MRGSSFFSIRVRREEGLFLLLGFSRPLKRERVRKTLRMRNMINLGDAFHSLPISLKERQWKT